MNWKFLKTCNHYPELILTLDGVKYYASDADGAPTFRGDLVVNLTRDPGIRAISGVYAIPELANHMIPFTKELVIGWSDMARPPVKASFWAALQLYCKTNNFKDILFHCQHGHGRTGTAFAAMLIALNKMSASDAIKKVRTLHCEHAIETEHQILYLILLDNELNNRLPPEEEEDLQKLIDSLESPRQTKVSVSSKAK